MTIIVNRYNRKKEKKNIYTRTHKKHSFIGQLHQLTSLPARPVCAFDLPFFLQPETKILPVDLFLHTLCVV